MKKQTILSSAAAVAAATVLVKFFGFMREVTLAATYGAGDVSDAFIVAFTAPNTVLALVATSVASVFIPAYSAAGISAKRFTSNILTILALIGLTFSIVFTILPQALAFLFASQFDAETSKIAADLLRIMVWAAIPIVAGGVLTSYLQIQKSFFLATLLTMPVNVFVILSIALSGFTELPRIMGYGVLVGNYAMLACMLTVAYRKGYSYRPVLSFAMPQLRILFVMLGPVILISLISNADVIIDRNFASSLASGSISSLNYANKVIGIITAFVGTSVATVLYPRMSEHAAHGKETEIRAYITEGFSKLLPLLLPAMIGIVILSKPLVRLLFERGSFSPEDTKHTAESLQMYAPLLVASSMNIIMIRAFYSMRDTKTPALISIVCVAAGVGLKFLLIGPYAHMGLALSSSIAATLTTVILLFSLRRRFGLMHLKRMGMEWVKMTLATAAMGAVVWLGMKLLPVMDGGTLMCAVYTGLLAFAGVAVYALMHLVLRTQFMRFALSFMRSLVSKRGKG